MDKTAENTKDTEYHAKDLKTRVPCNAANLIVATGALIIFTPDGSVVLTPKLARSIAKDLKRLADLAEIGFQQPAIAG